MPETGVEPARASRPTASSRRRVYQFRHPGVDEEGIEPPTSCASCRRSARLSYTSATYGCVAVGHGGRSRSRTCGLSRVKRTLYQLSYATE